MGLIGGIVGVAVLLFLTRSPGDFLILSSTSLGRPWAFLTYPFAEPLGGGFGVIFLLILAFWLFWVGGALERDLGSLRLGLLWVASTLAGAVCVIVGALVAHATNWVVAGSLLPISVFTVIWGIRNKTAAVQLMMVIPITGYWMAWLSVAIVFVEFGQLNLMIGAFACLPLALGWAFAANKIPGLTYGKPAVAAYKPSKEQVKKQEAFFDDVRKREQERSERERLRKLFEGGGDD
jgi:hypothetical protein